MSDWRFILADSSSYANIADITSLARSKSLSLDLNKPGSCTFNMSLEDDWANEITPVASCIKAYKNDTLAWSGFVMSMEESWPDNKVNVTCTGWLELLHRRVLQAQEVYTTANRGAIVLALLAIANAQYDTWMNAGTNTWTGTALSRTFEKWEVIGEAIDNIVEIEDGPDILVDPETRDLNVYDMRMTDQTDVFFGYGWGPDNVSTLKRVTDADHMRNYITAIGANEGSVTITDPDNIRSQYQRFHHVESLSSVENTTILQAWVNAEYALNKAPRVTYSMTPYPIADQRVIPSIFEDYNIGDKVYLAAKSHNLEVQKQALRVFGVQIGIDEEGNEKLGEIRSVLT